MTAQSVFERRVVETFSALKSGRFGSTVLSGNSRDGVAVELLPFTQDRIEDADTIRLLSEWRKAGISGFTKVFPVTEAGTRSWSRAQLIERRDRILFLLRRPGGPLVGHVGLSSFDFGQGTGEVDNIVRGAQDAPKGIMQAALEVLLDWSYRSLGLNEVRLRTLHDNSRALALYHRLNFVPFELHPLKRTETDDIVEWIPADRGDHIDRFMIAMRHARVASAGR